ncbi:MAG: hypothetical protein HYW25_00330 [Candidatus Aenigmarchaeota archaeon]|nr:hypothetical protein [Candidatus Aenigmarchaeota archaeon]
MAIDRKRIVLRRCPFERYLEGLDFWFGYGGRRTENPRVGYATIEEPLRYSSFEDAATDFWGTEYADRFCYRTGREWKRIMVGDHGSLEAALRRLAERRLEFISLDFRAPCEDGWMVRFLNEIYWRVHKGSAVSANLMFPREHLGFFTLQGFEPGRRCIRYRAVWAPEPSS